jgi:hypothetical protein
MKSKFLLAITLLLPFATMSSVAGAGQTYSHWQNGPADRAKGAKCSGILFAACRGPICDVGADALHVSRRAEGQHLGVQVTR